MKHRWLTGFALVCFILAAVFRFAMVGYGFMALILSGLGALALIMMGLTELRVKRRRLANGLSTVLALALLAGLTLFVVLEIPIVRNSRTDAQPEAPYVIVMGAGVNGTEPSLSLLNRLNTALSYLEQYPDAIAIVSGGQGSGEDITEAQCMETWLVARGIAPERIVQENRAVNSWENIAFSLEKIRERGETGPVRAAIVSSDYHLYRSKTLAEKFGIEAVGVAARTTLPLLKVNYYCREAFAVLKMYLTGQ